MADSAMDLIISIVNRSSPADLLETGQVMPLQIRTVIQVLSPAHHSRRTFPMTIQSEDLSHTGMMTYHFDELGD